MIEGMVRGEGEVSEHGEDLPGTVRVSRGVQRRRRSRWGRSGGEHSDAPLLQKIITQKQERERLLSHSAINAAIASQTDSTSCLCLSAVRLFRLVFLSYNFCCYCEHVQRLSRRLQSHKNS